MRLSFFRSVLLLSGAALGVTASPALAQSAGESESTPQSVDDEEAATRGLSVIVVTAERRQTAAQDTPVSVQAFDEGRLEASGVNNILDLGSVAPNLVITDSTGFIIPYIRGTGSSVIGAGIYASVATYVDGVYISRQTSGALDLDNVQSVEILAGPQGALYGRNATAGAMVITTRAARGGDAFDGRASIEVGNYDMVNLSARVSGGVSDNVGVTLSGSIRNRDGYIKNLNPAGFGQNQKDLDDEDSFSIVGALAIDPTPDFKITLRANYSESEDRGSCCYAPVGLDVFPGLIPGLNSNQTAIAALVGQLTMNPAAGVEAAQRAVLPTGFGGIYDPHISAFDTGVLSGNHPGGSGFFISQFIGSATLEYDFGGMRAKSITSYGDSKFNGATSILGEGPGLGFTVNVPSVGDIFVPLVGSAGFSANFPSETFSQEILLQSGPASSIQWTGGVYYFKESGSTDLTGDFFGANLYSARNDFEVESIAAYAQATLPLTDTLSVTGGLRYTDETFSIEDRFDPADPLSFPGIPNLGSLSQSSDNLTWLARLQYDSGPMLVYASVSTGFKSGALNSNNPIAGAADPETITAYEVGLKSDPAPGLRFNVAGFYYEYENIQQNVIDSGSGATFLINGGSAEVMGVDFELAYAPIDYLTLTVLGTVLDTESKADGVLGTGAVLPTKGNDLPGAASFAATFSLDWDMPISNSADLKIHADYVHSSGYYFDPENRVGTGGANNDGFGLVNASLGVALDDGRYEISIFGNNIFDDKYYRTGVVAAGFALLGVYGVPATYGIRGTVNF